MNDTKTQATAPNCGAPRDNGPSYSEPICGPSHYSETHEWVAVADAIGTVGISEHAQKELGQVVYVELPQVGRHVQAGQEVAVIESTKAASDVYAPVSGTIVAINEALKEHPEWINSAPETEGWLFRLRLSDPSELAQLQESAAYRTSLS